MNWLMRRYHESKDISYFFVFSFCLVMTIIFTILSYLFVLGASYWSILPISGAIYSGILTYSLTSYSKPKHKIEGHYDINDFYKVINGTKKVNFLFEYLVGLIGMNSSLHFFFHGYILEKFQNEHLNNAYLASFFIFSTITLFWVRMIYFKKLNQEPIASLEPIEFFKNFLNIEHAKWVYNGYINDLERMDRESILRGDANEKFSKRNFLNHVNYLKSKHKKELKLIKEQSNPSNGIKNIIKIKETLSAQNEK